MKLNIISSVGEERIALMLRISLQATKSSLCGMFAYKDGPSMVIRIVFVGDLSEQFNLKRTSIVSVMYDKIVLTNRR